MKMHGVRWTKIAGLALGISGCNVIAGINAGTPRGEGGGGSQGGGGTMRVCTPLTEKKACYTASAETEGRGVCKSGQMTCNAEGTTFGPCLDQVIPTAADDCANLIDTSCDDILTCPCTPNGIAPCYDGMPASTQDLGICKGGVRTCNAQGTGFGECSGQVKPTEEDCTTQQDENCDGEVNEMASGCVCDPTVGKPLACTSDKLGVCAAGTHACNPDGKSYGECIPKLLPSFEDCFTQEDEDCDGAPHASCTGTSILAASPGASTGDDSVFGSASDAMGNVFLGGVSGSSQGANYAVTSGAADAIKLDKNGALMWQKNYPSTGAGSYSVVRGVTVDATGNVVVVGDYQGTINVNGVSLTSTQVNSADVFVIKLLADGTLKWFKSYGTTGDQFGASISATANGDIFIVGNMAGMMSFGSTTLTASGSTDVFVARLDGVTGDAKWSKNFGDSSAQYGWDIVATPDGNMVVTGQAQGGIDFGGGNLGSGVDKNIFLAKLDGSSGNHLWSKSFGDSAEQVGYGVATDHNGNIALTGYASGKIDFGGGPIDIAVNVGDLFVASFAPDGQHRWSKFFGDSSMQAGRDIAADAAGNVLVTGYFIGSLKLGTTTLTNSGNGSTLDGFVAKFRGSDGTLGWARSFGDAPNDQLGRSITADLSANVIVGGTFKGAIDFGPPTSALTTQNNTFDSFWAKLAP